MPYPEDLLDLSKSRESEVQAPRLIGLLQDDIKTTQDIDVRFTFLPDPQSSAFYISSNDQTFDLVEIRGDLRQKIEEWTHGIFTVRYDQPAGENSLQIVYAPSAVHRQLNRDAHQLAKQINDHLKWAEPLQSDFLYDEEKRRAYIRFFPHFYGAYYDPKSYGIENMAALRRDMAPKVTEWTGGTLSLLIFHREARFRGLMASPAGHFFTARPTKTYPWPKPDNA